MPRGLLTAALALLMASAPGSPDAGGEPRASAPGRRLDALLQAARASPARGDDYRNPLCSWRTPGVCTASGPRSYPLRLAQAPFQAFVDPAATLYVNGLARRLTASIGVPGTAQIVVAPCGQPNSRAYDDYVVICSEAIAASYGPDGDLSQRSEDALAWIVAHEMAHVLLGNSDTAAQSRTGFGLASMFEHIGAFVLAGPFLLLGRRDEEGRAERFGRTMLRVSPATRMLERATLRAETDADMIAVDLMVRAGWSARAAFIGLGITTGDIHSTYRAPREWLEGHSPLTGQERRASLKAYIAAQYPGPQPRLVNPPAFEAAASGLAKSAMVVTWAQDLYRNYAFFFYCGEGSAGWVVDTSLSFDPLKPYRCAQLVGLRRSAARRLAIASAPAGGLGGGPAGRSVSFSPGFAVRSIVGADGVCEAHVFQPGLPLEDEAPETFGSFERPQLDLAAGRLLPALPPTSSCPRLRVVGWGRAGAIALLASIAGRRTNVRAFDAMVYEVPWRALVGQQYLPFVSVTHRAQPQLVIPAKGMPPGPAEVWINPHSSRTGLLGLIEDLDRAAPA